MEAPIKLLDIGDIHGVKRLQSQLSVGKDLADFILENGILKNWSYKNGSVDFHETSVEYEIVKDKSEMLKQRL